MQPLDLCVFLTSYSITVSIAALVDLIRCRRVALLLNVIVALVAIVVTTVVGYYLDPGSSYLQLLGVLIRERDVSSIVSIGLGVAVALAWVARLADSPASSGEGSRSRGVSMAFAQLLWIASIVGVVLCAQAFIWKAILGIQRDPAARSLVPEFVIQKIADLEFAPIRIAAGEDGKIYVSYDYFEAWGAIGGAIIELSQDGESGKYRQKIVADSTLLMRSYGLVARDGDLFVSRTGISSKADQGNVSYESTGAVTQLKDLDGDGYFEYANDIITGLPGARGPDTMQQNNGIAFAPDGSLFVTNACSANRSLDEHPWAGTVLKLSPDFSKVDVFARGFRNPFGIVVGPDDELFVTDNDIDENPGDELNHVVRGAHYGHPYVVPNEPSVETQGFRDQIYLGELESNLLGMAYVTSPTLPEEFRNCIYMADFMGARILRFKLERSGDTYKVSEMVPFVTLSTPLDIAVAPSGDMFVISRRTQNVYRIRLTTAAK